MLENLKKYHIILASNSPRRRELLAGLDIEYEVKVLPGIDESYPDTLAAEDIPQYISREKAAAYEAALQPDDLVITADTIVWTEGRVLGKPKDETDAMRMLSLLSGTWHEVHTGLCLIAPDGFMQLEADTTRVRFLPLDGDLIRRYVSTGEPMDKAGAYAIQGLAGTFVSRIEGSPSNVVGLPLGLLSQFLQRAGVPFPGPAR